MLQHRTIFFALWVAGCNASFTDLSSPVVITDSGPNDLGTMDADLGMVTAGVIARGGFQGFHNYRTTGMAELYMSPAGQVELRLTPDFSTAAVPGPVVVLTREADFGPNIDPSRGHINLGALKSTQGAQSYPLPGGDRGHRFAWIYCAPFTVEVARSMMRDL